MIPLQIYDSTKTTIIPLVELWWNYRGGITKIVSESAALAPASSSAAGAAVDVAAVSPGGGNRQPVGVGAKSQLP
jgi:hypothetical protein